MKTTLPNQITSAAEAKRFLAALKKNEEQFDTAIPAKIMQQIRQLLPDPEAYLLSLEIKFSDAGIDSPFEITGAFSDRNGINIFTPDWFESDEAADWYANNWEMVEDALNDPYRD